MFLNHSLNIHFYKEKLIYFEKIGSNWPTNFP